MTSRPHEDGEPCHCEEPQATKQSLFQAKIASLRSQYGCCYRICGGQGVQVLKDGRMRLLHEPDNVGIENVSSSCGSGALLLPLGSEVGEVLALFLIPLEGSRRVEPCLRAAEVQRGQINFDGSHCDPR